MILFLSGRHFSGKNKKSHRLHRLFFFSLFVSRIMPIFATMFEREIEEYELVRQGYQEKVVEKMSRQQWMEYNEILFSAHSCAIEGNSFTVDDTRILREQGMAMIPVGRSLLECTEMADHFRAFDYMASHLDVPFDEALLKEVNRLQHHPSEGWKDKEGCNKIKTYGFRNV